MRDQWFTHVVDGHAWVFVADRGRRSTHEGGMIAVMARTETPLAMRAALESLPDHLDTEVSAQRILALIGVAGNPSSPPWTA